MTPVRTEETVDGTVRAMTIAGAGTEPVFHVDIDTTSGPIRLAFVGYRSIPGFRVGRDVTVTGRLSSIDGGTIFNPRYTLKGEKE